MTLLGLYNILRNSNRHNYAEINLKWIYFKFERFSPKIFKVFIPSIFALKFLTCPRTINFVSKTFPYNSTRNFGSEKEPSSAKFDGAYSSEGSLKRCLYLELHTPEILGHRNHNLWFITFDRIIYKIQSFFRW